MVGGQFQQAGPLDVGRIAMWDNGAWSDLGGGVAGSYPLATEVRALARLEQQGAGPLLCVGGAFQTAGSLPAANIAAWDGRQWLPFGNGLTGAVRALTLFDDDGPGPHPARLERLQRIRSAVRRVLVARRVGVA